MNRFSSEFGSFRCWLRSTQYLFGRCISMNRQVRADLHRLRVRGALRSGVDSDRVCGRCLKPMGFWTRSRPGSVCPLCRKLVCEDCRTLVNSPSDESTDDQSAPDLDTSALPSSSIQMRPSSSAGQTQKEKHQERPGRPPLLQLLSRSAPCSFDQPPSSELLHTSSANVDSSAAGNKSSTDSCVSPSRARLRAVFGQFRRSLNEECPPAELVVEKVLLPHCIVCHKQM